VVCVFVARTLAGNAHPRYTTALQMERAICPVQFSILSPAGFPDVRSYM